jgi:predicted nuclease of predicted toxin-antitoxin system
VRVKLDENVPRSVLALLVAAGHDADTVVGEGLTGSVDSVVVQAAADAGRLLITLDRGLGDVRRYPPGSHSGILVLRVDEQSAAAVRRVVQALLDVHDLDSLTGTIAIVQRGWLRIRR